ncbi:Mg-protoporphyrin IX chelatase [Rhynchospora pubera]|uniref:Mg-protoporphyrin IX chelatase n=1 Tax=Rhynchospora pubera TaxID=906938 RepID=A0AAV8F703_9POAL|nr:Mg-protoporphyrin IX chelatase [Rhynchospora pubera]
MADCGFHSPHFSEEIAYLPPWLQPHQLPIVLAAVKANSSTPMQTFQKVYFGENTCLQQNGQQYSNSEAGYNSCHLYLSGDDNSLPGSIPSTGNALHLSLHLSCTASQGKSPPLSINNEASRNTRAKPDIEVKETHTDQTRYHIKTTKRDTLTLSQAGIKEAIELSIAASEAMVITEVVSLDSEASHFPVSNALQSALRVKEAREELFSGGEDVSCASLEQENDESDSLSELDESVMAVAYADVGLSDNGAPDSNSHAHRLNSCPDSALVPCSIKESTSEPQIFSFRNMSSKRVTAAAMEIRKRGSDAFGGTDRNLEEFEDNLEKDQEIAIQGNTSTRKIIKELFVRESSSISESMDTSGIFPFAPLEEPQNEIVASSTPTNARNRCLNESVHSSMDALCSVVPYSLSNPCMDQPSNEDLVGLQENLSTSQNALDGSGVVTRITRTLKEYSMVPRDVQFNKAPQTFDTKHLDDSVATLNEVREEINSKRCSELQTREVDEGVGTNSKRVRFLEAQCVDKEVKKSDRLKHRKGHLASKSSRLKGAKYGLNCNSQVRRRKCSSFAGNSRERKEMIFLGLDFLLTGLSNKKLRELHVLIRQYGGCVLTKLPDCPSNLRAKLVEATHWRPPVVICPKKLGTNKFLYGCAVDSWVLHDQWLVDSVEAGHLLPPSKYVIKQLRASAQSYSDGDIFCFKRHTYIFHGMGFFLYGKPSFCSKFLNIIKHGGGQVFQSLQSLVHSLTAKNIKNGVILVEEARSSRHLKSCALEHNIQTLPVNWIIETLYTGELAPLKEERYPHFRRTKVPKPRANDDGFDMSQEI